MRSRIVASFLPTYPEDFRTLGLLAAQTGVLAAHACTGNRWWLIPACVLVLSVNAAKHNHTHRALFRSRFANRVLDFWLTLLSGTPAAGILVAHRSRHHAGYRSPEDLVRCAHVREGGPCFALFAFFPRVVRETRGVFRRDHDAVHRRGLRRRVVFERVALAAFLAVCVALSPVGAFFVVVTPWLVGQWFLVTINLAQHDGCDAGDAFGHSRNFVGAASNWLLLNNGYHTAHHERPGLHWSRLPAFHGSEIAPRIPARIDCVSFAGFWREWASDRRRRMKGPVA